MPHYSISYQRQIEAEGTYRQITPDLMWCEDSAEVVAYVRSCLDGWEGTEGFGPTRAVVVDAELDYFPSTDCPENPSSWRGLPAGLFLTVVTG